MHPWRLHPRGIADPLRHEAIGRGGGGVNLLPGDPPRLAVVIDDGRQVLGNEGVSPDTGDDPRRLAKAAIGRCSTGRCVWASGRAPWEFLSPPPALCRGGGDGNSSSGVPVTTPW